MRLPDFFSRFREKKKPEHKLYNQLSQSIIQASESESVEVLKKTHSRNTGLTQSDARSRLKKYGENRPAQHKKKTKTERLIDSYKNPLNYLLTLLIFVSLFTA